MKDDISDLLSSIFPGDDKNISSRYEELIKKSAGNTSKAWDMLKGVPSNEELTRQLNAQNEELKRLAAEMENDTLRLTKTENEPAKATAEQLKAVPGKAFTEEDILSAFGEIESEAANAIIGQDEFLKKLSTAFKRPFLTSPKENSALNTILVSGSPGSGKHSAIKLFTKLMNEKKLLNSGEVCFIDMSLYPSQDEAALFLHDTYIALENVSRVVVFVSPEAAHPAIIMMLGELMREGRMNLSSRYVSQKGILVESGKALTRDAVSYLSVKDQYIIVLSEKSPRGISDVFGSGFNTSLGDIAQTGEFTSEAVNKIALVKLEEIKKKARADLKLEVTAGAGFENLVGAAFNKEEGVHAIEDYASSVLRALSEYKLREGKALSGALTLANEENEALIVAADKKTALCDLLPRISAVELDEVKAELNEIVGLGEVKKYVLSLEDNFKVQARRRSKGLKTENTSMHMIFTGNPGTGKTTMARIVAKYLKAVGILSSGQLVEVTRADLVGRYVGHTAPLTTSVIKSAHGGVLFIDEAYSLYRGENDSFGLEAIDTIVKCMEEYRDSMVFVLAGYTKEMQEFLTANSGLKSRFPNIIEFPDYTGAELTQIACSIAKSKGYTVSIGVEEEMTKYFNTVQAFNSREAGNGRLARNKVEEAILNQAARIVDKPEAPLEILLKEDFDFDDMPM